MKPHRPIISWSVRIKQGNRCDFDCDVTLQTRLQSSQPGLKFEPISLKIAHLFQTYNY